MANKSYYTPQRISAPDPTKESLKTFTRKINEQNETLFMKAFGNIEFKDLHSAAQKIISEKVDATALVNELAEKADIGDLAYIGETPPETPELNKVWLNMGAVPNEWLRWTARSTNSARYYSVTADGESVAFPDLSDQRTLSVTVKTVAAQATGTVSPATPRSITVPSTAVVTVNGNNTTLTSSAPLCGGVGFAAEIGSDGHVIIPGVLVTLNGTETIANAGLQAGVTGKYRFWLTAGYTLGASVATNNTVGKIISSHFPGLTANQTYLGSVGASIDINGRYEITVDLTTIGAVDGDSDATKNTKVKNWLAAQHTAETPVQVLYQRATNTTSTVSPVTINGTEGANTVTSSGSSVSVSYTGSGWTNVGNTAELASLVTQIGAMTLNNGDFRGLLQSITKLANGLLLTGLGGTLQLLLGPARISFLDNGEEVAYITGNKLYILSAEFIGEIKIGNYFITKTSDGGLVFK